MDKFEHIDFNEAPDPSKYMEFTRIAKLRGGGLGQLAYLPLEICNNIYELILADFSPVRSVSMFALNNTRGIPENCACIQHAITTGVVRASRDVHREAYDCMVKKNRFVLFTSWVISHCEISCWLLPIMSANADHVRNFKGYVFEVVMAFPGRPVSRLSTRWRAPFQAMILGSDLEKLCVGLKRWQLDSRRWWLASRDPKDPLTLELKLWPSIDRYCSTPGWDSKLQEC